MASIMICFRKPKALSKACSFPISLFWLVSTEPEAMFFTLWPNEEYWESTENNFSSLVHHKTLHLPSNSSFISTMTLFRDKQTSRSHQSCLFVVRLTIHNPRVGMCALCYAHHTPCFLFSLRPHTFPNHLLISFPSSLCALPPLSPPSSFGGGNINPTG